MKKTLIAAGLISLAAFAPMVRTADFNGDGTQDIGIYRPIQGLWSIRNITKVYFGVGNDSPVPSDYTGDKKDDIAVFRPGNGLWAIRNVTKLYFGSQYDIPVSAAGPTHALEGNIAWSSGMFLVYNHGNGPSVWGKNDGGGNAIRGDAYGVNGIGVYGEGDYGPGIVGRSASGYGVEGVSDSSNAGVYAHSTSGYGLFAHSDNNHSIYVDGAGQHGLYVQSAGWHGVAVYSAAVAGMWVHSAAHDGILVDTAGWDGVHVTGPVGGNYYGSGMQGDEDFVVRNTGEVRSRVGFNTPASDFAEVMEVEGAKADFQPGDVLVISDAKNRAVELSSTAYSRSVAGVYSQVPGFVGGRPVSGDQPAASLPVALLGIVPCKASVENGPIRRGDLLVTSSTPGHAMRANNPPPGSILGKALEPLNTEAGTILVLVTLQ